MSNKAFYDGYEFFCKQSGSMYSAYVGNEYVSKVVLEIDELTKNTNNFAGNNTAADKLKGDIAEFWHSGTFNIDAAVKGSKYRIFVDRSHELGSADILSNFGQKFGLKYYKTGGDSAKQQAKSIFERYKEYLASGNKNNKMSLEEYLEANGLTDKLLSDPLYNGQIRIIPSDQLSEAIKFLEEKIAKESATRPEQVKRYQETLKLLKSKISHDGVESIELTKVEAEQMARIAKQGGFDPEKYGLTTEELIAFSNILNQARRAGMTAATISLVLRVAPEIVKAIEYLIINGEVNGEQFKNIGFAALTGASEGFIRGTVSASITASCKAGLLGASLKTVNPTIIGAITVLTMNTMQSAFFVVIGKRTSKDMVENLVREMFTTSVSLLGGYAGEVAIKSVPVLGAIPMLGFMIGSFVGTILGSFVYSTGYSAVLSFCVNSGFTMFGLVEQDYIMPTETLEEIGIDVFEYDKFEYNKFGYDKFEYSKFEYDRFEPLGIDIQFLRRGVIGVRKVGYV